MGDSSATISGANRMAHDLFYGLIHSKRYKKIFLLTDAPPHKIESPAELIWTDYLTVDRCFAEHGFPDVAFVSDLAMDSLLRLRNSLKAPFPVVGLLHSFGSRAQFEKLSQVARAATPADSLICPSESSARVIRNFGIQPTVIPHGIDVEKFKPARRKNKRPTLLHLSRINPFTKMDIMPLIRNFEQIIPECPDVLLMIVGEAQSPAYLANVREYIRKKNLNSHVQLVTHVDQAHIERYYQQADVFISLADLISETFGLSVIEAMACGLPVIVSDWDGQKELVGDEQGFKIPTYMPGTSVYDEYFNRLGLSDFGDLAIQSVAMDNERVRQKMKQLLQNKALREKMGKSSRARVQKKFGRDTMIASYQTHFEKCLRKKIKNFPNSEFSQIHHLYSHYATQTVSTQKFELTKSGKKFVAREELHHTFEKYISFYRYLSDILVLLSTKSQNHKELCKKIGAKSVMLDLLYLLKHDLISLRS